MKRILVCTTTFPRWDKDVTPDFVYSLSEKLSENFEVVVLAPFYPGSKLKEIYGPCFQVKRFKYFFPDTLHRLCYGGGVRENLRSLLAKAQLPSFFLMLFIRGMQIGRKKKVSAIHAHWILPQGVVAFFISKLLHIPYLVTVHGTDLNNGNNFFMSRIKKIVMNNSIMTTVNSRATYEVAKHLGVNKNKLRLIPMGVDTTKFSFTDMKRKRGRVLFVGRLIKIKGIDTLIRAFSKVVRTMPFASLVIVGAGPERRHLERLAIEYELQDKVIFKGALNKDVLIEVYSEAEVCVLPSTRASNEGLGIVLIEAQASGTAVIGSNIGGIPDVISDGETGLLFEPENDLDLYEKIVRLIKDERLRGRLCKNALLSVERFSWDTVGNEFNKLFIEVIK